MIIGTECGMNTQAVPLGIVTTMENQLTRAGANMSSIKCEHCGEIAESPRAIRTAFGDGEPDVHSFFTWCCKCNRETDLNGKLTHQEEQIAVNNLNNHHL